MKPGLINESLKLIRLYWGKTQSELARDLGVSQSYVSEVEKGNRQVTLDLLSKYSDVLCVPISSLLLFAEHVEGAPPLGRGKRFLAGKALDLLASLVPNDVKEAG